MRMVSGDLSPAGCRILAADKKLEKNFIGYHSTFVDSGTSALALALLDAKLTYIGSSVPLAIVPGYCCPDLISACEFAGVKAIAVDCGQDDPSFDVEKFSEAINEDVVAVIAVNFLGIRTDLSIYTDILKSKKVSAKIIEDNAQWFPVEYFTSEADYSLFSFGRGKPVSLLGGGLLLTKHHLDQKTADVINNCHQNDRYLALKIRIYNAVLNPVIYQMANRNPFFSIGSTRFTSHEIIREIDANRLSWLQCNIDQYAQNWKESKFLQELVFFYQHLFSGCQSLGVSPSRMTGQWLRYPLLCKTTEQKTRLLTEFKKNGLGASPFYPTEITRIDGVGNRVAAQFPLVNSRKFAERIMTLPVHDRVDERARQKMEEIIRRMS